MSRDSLKSNKKVTKQLPIICFGSQFELVLKNLPPGRIAPEPTGSVQWFEVKTLVPNWTSATLHLQCRKNKTNLSVGPFLATFGSSYWNLRRKQANIGNISKFLFFGGCRGANCWSKIIFLELFSKLWGGTRGFNSIWNNITYQLVGVLDHLITGKHHFGPYWGKSQRYFLQIIINSGFWWASLVLCPNRITLHKFGIK